MWRIIVEEGPYEGKFLPKDPLGPNFEFREPREICFVQFDNSFEPPCIPPNFPNKYKD